MGHFVQTGHGTGPVQSHRQFGDRRAVLQVDEAHRILRIVLQHRHISVDGGDGVQRTIQYVARTAGDQTLHIVFLGNLVECATQFRRDAVARCQSVDAAEFRFLTGGDAVRVCLGLGLGIVDKIAGQQHCIRGTGQIQHTDHKFIAVGHNPFVGGVQLGDADMAFGESGRTLRHFWLDIGGGGQESGHRLGGGHGEVHDACARADGGQHVLGAGRAQ